MLGPGPRSPRELPQVTSDIIAAPPRCSPGCAWMREEMCRCYCEEGCAAFCLLALDGTLGRLRMPLCKRLLQTVAGFASIAKKRR